MKDPLYGDTIGSDDEDADVPEAFANARASVRARVRACMGACGRA